MPLWAFKARENPSVTQRLTKRDELSFLTVLALPKASSRGLALMIWSSRVPCRETQEQCSHVGLLEHPFRHDSDMPIRPTCNLPGSSFFFSPVTAIVAKYWMTRFVFTVFPAPDSPLSNKNQRRDQNYSSHCQHLRQSPPIREEGKITYVIRMDWFSRSVKEKSRPSFLKIVHSHYEDYWVCSD